MKANRNVAIVAVAAVLLLAFILNPSSVYMFFAMVQSVAITALCVVAILYLAKRI